MLYFIFLAILGTILLFVFIFLNKQGLLYRLLRKVIAPGSRTNIRKIYMGRFREHREPRSGRNIIVQLLPFLLVMGLIFFLGNQYIYFGTVRSGSMEPVFKKGDLVMMQAIYKEPHVGDIISSSVFGYKESITHRVIEINNNGIRTKGDNNPAQDGWVITNSNIIGKAVIVGGKPVVVRGLGGILVAEAGEFSIMNRLTDDFALRSLFNQFRSMQPLIIFFATIMYFFILNETRREEEKRFGRRERNSIKKITGDKSE
ncbi:MAG TPA: signal peptidase I [Candidatus Limnocylindrales bacterium]|nr:signal peptidase I [Candidatus Limnocylindrales bacterium]